MRLPHGRAEWNRNARSQLAAGASVLYGPSERHELVGPAAAGGHRYRTRFQRAISYRPDPINHPHRYLPSFPALESVPGGGLLSDEGEAVVLLPPRGRGAFVLNPRQLGEEAVTMRFEGANNVQMEQVTPTSVVYNNIFTDTDLAVTVKADGWKLDWIFHGPGAPTSITAQYTAPFDREVYLVDSRRVRVNLHPPGSTHDFSFMDVVAPFYDDDEDRRWTSLSMEPGNRVVMTLPDMTGVAYPYRFDPTTTFVPDADVETWTVDGTADRAAVNETFATIRAGAGNNSFAAGGSIWCGLKASTTTDQFEKQSRSYSLFDTRVLAGGWVTGIAAADISYFGYVNTLTTALGHVDMDLVLATGPASDTDVVNSDYDIGGFSTGTVYSSLNTSSISSSAYNEWAFDSVPAQLTNGQIFRMGHLTSWDTDSSFGGTWASGSWTRILLDSADGTNAPYLEVTFEVGETNGQWIEGTGDDSAASSWTTSSWTPTANVKCFLVLTMAYTDASDGDPTVSGNGLTWTKKAGSEVSSTFLTYIFEGSAEASPSTGAITVTMAGSDTCKDHYYLIFQSNRYQTWVQGATGYAITSTTAGSTATLSAARKHRNLLLVQDVWRHASETGGPYPGLVPGVNDFNVVVGADQDLSAIATMVNYLVFPDPENTETLTAITATRTTPGETVSKISIVGEIAAVDDDLTWMDNGVGAAAASSFTTNSVTPTANYDTYLFVAVRLSDLNDGNLSASGLGHTWSTVQANWASVNPDHGWHVFKGTGGTTTGVATITAAGSDTISFQRWMMLELPDSWTVTQSKFAQGNEAGGGSPFTATATFDSSTAATNRMVATFMDIDVNDEELWPATSDIFDMVHDATEGTSALGLDPDGGAYTANTWYFDRDSGSGTLYWGLTAVEFAMTVTVNKVVDEALNLVEAAVKVLAPNKIVSEALNLVEATAKILGFNRVVDEALNIVEGTAKILGLNKVVDETLNLVESAVRWCLRAEVVDETVNMVEGTVYSTIDLLIRVFRDSISGTRVFRDSVTEATRDFRDTFLSGTRSMK